ncbi:MAG: hypothetical protein ACJAYU_002203 [Bradymonadia bacterium]
MNAAAFLLAAATLFAVAVHPASDDVGLVFLTWLAVAGTFALVLEERTLAVVMRLKPGIHAKELFGRRGRRRFRADPTYFFEPTDLCEYQRRTRATTLLGITSLLALVGVTIAVSMAEVLEVSAAIEEAKQPWWFRN